MAADSYHRFEDKGIWINDSLMEVYLYFMLIVLEEQAHSSWCVNLKEKYIHQSLGYNSTMMDLYLNEYLVSLEDRERYLDILKQTQNKVRKNETSISLDLLKKISMRSDLLPNWISPLDTNLVLNVGKKLIELVESGVPPQEPDDQ